MKRALPVVALFVLISSQIIPFTLASDQISDVPWAVKSSIPVDQKSLVAIVSNDSKSMPANLRFLGVIYDLYDEGNLTSLDISKYQIIIFDYMTGIRGQEVQPSFDLTDWVQRIKPDLIQWIQEGGSILDFSGGEGFILFDIVVQDAHDSESLLLIKEDDLLFQVPNVFKNSNFTSIMFADAYVTGGTDLASFNMLANGTRGSTILTRSVGNGKIIYCAILQIRSIFRRGLLENMLYWASNGVIRRVPLTIKELKVLNFIFLFPSFSTSILQFNETMSFVYDQLVEMAGRSPQVGEVITIDFTKDLDWDLKIWAAGLAGNPIYVDVWQLPELIGSERVLNGIIYHELGHVVFGWADFLKGSFGEAVADIGLFYALDLLNLREYYNFGEQMDKNELVNYVAQGADFTKITSSIIVGALLTLKDEYGWGLFKDYFKLVDPSFNYMAAPYNERLSMFVYYLSVAAGQDLVSQFRKWGFDVNYFDKIETALSISSPSSCYVKDNIEISGYMSPALSGASIEVRITGPETSTNDVTTQNGRLSLSYTPSAFGRYIVQAFYAGDAEHSESQSSIISFEAKKIPTILTINVYPSEVPRDVITGGTDQVRISGTVVGPTGSITESLPIRINMVGTVMTSSSGEFSAIFTPISNGTLSIVAVFDGNDQYIGSSASALITVVTGYTTVFLLLVFVIVGIVGIVYLRLRKQAEAPPP